MDNALRFNSSQPFGSFYNKTTATINGPLILIMRPIKNIVPYLEVFNTSELFILTQTIDEEAFNEDVVARQLYSMTKALYDSYDVDPKESLGKFDNKAFFPNSALIFLIYLLDGYKTTKRVHLTVN